MAAENYLGDVRAKVKQAKIGVKVPPQPKRAKYTTLDNLKGEMHLSLQQVSEIAARDDAMPFKELVLGFSERIENMAADMVHKERERARDAKMLKSIR